VVVEVDRHIEGRQLYPATGELAALARRVASLEQTRKDTASSAKVGAYLRDILRRVAALERPGEA
jgi:hypothetical protein